VAVVALELGAPSAGFAQQSPPTVTVTAGQTTLAVGATGPLPAGPTRFEVVRAGGGELSLAIAALRPGVTREQFTSTLRSRDLTAAAIELVHLDSGVSLFEQDRRRAVTIDLRPNSNYVVINLSGNRASDFEIADFSVSGQSSGALAPRADARVHMVDLRFRGATALPLRGVVRFENSGWAPHLAIAAPLRRGASTRAVARALRRFDERLVRLLDLDSSIQPQAAITRGAVNYNEVRFPRRGRYVMFCLVERHHAQGMYRFIHVR
jgi:hypothetical protein